MSSSSALSSARRRRAAPEFNQSVGGGSVNVNNGNTQQQQQSEPKPQITPVQLLQQHDLRLHKLENDIPDVINEIQQNMALLLQERDERLVSNVNQTTNSLNYSAMLSDVESQNNKIIENNNNQQLNQELNQELNNKVITLEQDVERLQKLLIETNTTLLKLVNKNNNERDNIEHIVSDDTISKWLTNNDDNVLDDYCDFEHHKKINVNMSDLTSEGDNNINVDIQELKDDLYDNNTHDNSDNKVEDENVELTHEF